MTEIAEVEPIGNIREAYKDFCRAAVYADKEPVRPEELRSLGSSLRQAVREHGEYTEDSQQPYSLTTTTIGRYEGRRVLFELDIREWYNGSMWVYLLSKSGNTPPEEGKHLFTDVITELDVNESNDVKVMTGEEERYMFRKYCLQKGVIDVQTRRKVIQGGERFASQSEVEIVEPIINDMLGNLHKG
jgi:hypothetical protein